MSSALLLAIQLAIGVTFLFSGASKVIHPLRFANAVAESEVIPFPRILFVCGLLLIPAELVIGCAHLTGWLIILVAPTSILLLLTFCVMIAKQLTSGRAVPCHCFGVDSSEMISTKSIIRVVLLILGELAVTIRLSPHLTLESWSRIVLLSNLDQVVVLLSWTTALCVMATWISRIPDLLCLLLNRPISKLKIIVPHCMGEEL